MLKIPQVKLNNGNEIPTVGLGVFLMKEKGEAYNAVEAALKMGYRLIDTASIYKNEEEVGRAINDSGIKREEVFVTTKVWNSDQGYDSTINAYEASLGRLGLEYVDMYLIHWPGKHLFVKTYKALETLYFEGRVKTIGVSNFDIKHLDSLLKNTSVVPAINQIELHPHYVRNELRSYCMSKGIIVQAWSPLKRGEDLLSDPMIKRIAQKYTKTSAQIILRWHFQNSVCIIPKTVKPSRMCENASLFDFELSSNDMEIINALNCNSELGPNAESFF